MTSEFIIDDVNEDDLDSSDEDQMERVTNRDTMKTEMNRVDDGSMMSTMHRVDDGSFMTTMNRVDNGSSFTGQINRIDDRSMVRGSFA